MVQGAGATDFSWVTTFYFPNILVFENILQKLLKCAAAELELFVTISFLKSCCPSRPGLLCCRYNFCWQLLRLQIFQFLVSAENFANLIFRFCQQPHLQFHNCLLQFDMLHAWLLTFSFVKIEIEYNYNQTSNFKLSSNFICRSKIITFDSFIYIFDFITLWLRAHKTRTPSPLPPPTPTLLAGQTLHHHHCQDCPR